MSGLKVAVLGATGAVGQEFLAILAERKFPIAELRLLSSARSAGKKIDFLGKHYHVEEAKPEAFQGLDLVLSSAGGSVSKQFAKDIVKAGALMVDNTSAFRMDPDVPLVVPEINAEDIQRHKGIIANPNCSTILMVVPLWPLHRAARIKRVAAATYQAVSGAGAKAMHELEHQTRQILQGERPTKEIFPHQIAFNLFSHNSAIQEDGYCEEEIKMIRETRKIMHDDGIGVVATTIRVPVYRAHSEALFVEFEKPISPDDVRRILAGAPGVKLQDDPAQNHFPMPLEVSGRDEIYVGRIRKDPSVANGIAMFIAGDQIRKGAALNAVQIAEYWLKHVRR